MKHNGPCKPWCSIRLQDLCHGPICCPHLHKTKPETKPEPKRAEK